MRPTTTRLTEPEHDRRPPEQAEQRRRWLWRHRDPQRVTQDRHRARRPGTRPATHALASWSTTRTAAARPRRAPIGAPRLARRAPGRDRRRRLVGHECGSAGGAGHRHRRPPDARPSADRAVLELDAGGVAPVGRRALVDRVGQRVGSDAVEVVGHDLAAGRRSTARSGRRAPGRPPCAGPGRPRQLAGVALGAQLGVSSVSMTTTRPSSCATAVPGRGVARISTSSGGERHAGQADAAVGAGTRPRWRAPRP